MTALNDAEIETLEKAAKAATSGPWVRWVGHAEVKYGTPKVNRIGIIRGHIGSICECDDKDVGEREAVRNAAFIATANPTTILSLIARLRDAEAALLRERQATRIEEENRDRTN